MAARLASIRPMRAKNKQTANDGRVQTPAQRHP
jgi:hypothetical protein